MSIEDTTATEVPSGYKSNSQKDLMRMIRTVSDSENKKR